MLLRRALPAAIGIGGVSVYTFAHNKRRPSSDHPNGQGLPDPEWYEQQNAHILLNLPLYEEARQGWWHEVTRRLRDQTRAEDVDGQCPNTGATLLHLAAGAGRRRLVEELIAVYGADSLQDQRGRLPLHYCAEHGSETVAATLAEHTKGFDINAPDQTGATALSIAARLGHVRLVRWLLARSDLEPMKRDLYGTHALHKAVSFGQFACVDALLANARVREQVDLPVGAIDPAVPSRYAAKSGGETALHLAAGHTYYFNHTNHTRIAKSLLVAGADPNLTRRSDARTTLHCAVAAGNVAVLREIVSCGRVRASTWTARDCDGLSAKDLAKGDGTLIALLQSGRRAAAEASMEARLPQNG